MTRTARIDRKTKETQIELELNLDGSGKADIATGVGFFDHMLDLSLIHISEPTRRYAISYAVF